jgi:hypothetical protein
MSVFFLINKNVLAKNKLYIGNCDKFYFTLNLKFEFECEFTKYPRGTKYLLAMYQTSQVQILINPKILELDRM